MKKIIVPILLACFAIYYILPLLATILYASSTTWSKSLLPEGITLRWFQQLLHDRAFFAAAGRSLLLATVVLLAILFIMVPTIIWVNLFFPKISSVMEKLVLLPYAIPGVILVTALLRTYSKTPISMFIVLVGALFVMALPLVFLGITNQMRLINVKELIEAASTLGAPMRTVLFQILFPSIRIGMTLVSLMVFSSVFGEYMLTNLLIGGRFETLRIYMLRRMNENGHLASAVMVLYLIFMIVIALTTFFVMNRQKKQLFRLKAKIAADDLSLSEGVVVSNVLEHS